VFGFIELVNKDGVFPACLGHSDVKITPGTYGHLYPDSGQKLTQTLEGLVTLQASETSKELTRSGEKSSQKIGNSEAKSPTACASAIGGKIGS
jgi:hypothetical protein